MPLKREGLMANADAGQFPPPDFPTVFADGVLSAAWDAGVVKLFLYRNDPDFKATGARSDKPFRQLVLPIHGFAAMSIFHERILRTLRERGEISEEVVAVIRK